MSSWKCKKSKNRKKMTAPYVPNGLYACVQRGMLHNEVYSMLVDEYQCICRARGSKTWLSWRQTFTVASTLPPSGGRFYWWAFPIHLSVSWHEHGKQNLWNLLWFQWCVQRAKNFSVLIHLRRAHHHQWQSIPFLSLLQHGEVFPHPPLPEQVHNVLDLSPPSSDIQVLFLE